MKKKFAVLAIVLVSATFAFAADDAFSRADKNKDGQLSKQEYLDAVSAAFDKYDTNQDGFLTRDELSRIYKIDVNKFIKETDTNNDSKLSKREILEAAEKQFSKLDKDKDDNLSRKEWQDRHKAKDSMLVLFRF